MASASPTLDSTREKLGARVDTAALVSHHGTAWKELARQLGVDAPDLPEAVAVCADAARPGYTTIDATEFKDSPRVLDAKEIQGHSHTPQGHTQTHSTCLHSLPLWAILCVAPTIHHHLQLAARAELPVNRP